MKTCKACAAKKSALYREANKDKVNAKRRQARIDNPEFNRHYNLKAAYGIGVPEWNAIFEKQNEKCAICGTTESKGRGWQTDHCHQCGKMRAILCHHCNSLLGHAMENPEILKASIKYLRNHKHGKQF